MHAYITTFFFFIFSGAHGATVHDANVFMDLALGREIPELSRRYGLDPLKVHGFVSNLGTRDTFYANLKHINVTGLSQVRRYGNCSKPGYSSPGRLTVGCNVILDRITVNIVSDLKYMGARPRTIRTVAKIDPNYALVEATTIPQRPPLVTMKPLKPFVPKLNFTGLGDVPLSGSLERGYAFEVSRMLERELKSEYVEYLSMAFERVPFPH
ncbi:unnamed protein product [Ixodes hexagonus]